MAFIFATFSPLLDGEGSDTPLQYSCLENPVDRGAWWAAVHGVTKSWTRLSNFTFAFHFHALEKEMATHLCSCLENARDEGAWWAAVYGVAQSQTRLKRLSSSSSSFTWHANYCFRCLDLRLSRLKCKQSFQRRFARTSALQLESNTDNRVNVCSLSIVHVV